VSEGGRFVIGVLRPQQDTASTADNDGSQRREGKIERDHGMKYCRVRR